MLTERYGTSNLARKRVLRVPRLIRLGREHGWDDERIRAERLNFEHLVRLLYDLA